MKSAGTYFGSHLLVPGPPLADWAASTYALMQDDFVEWLRENVGNGVAAPRKSMDDFSDWFWLDNRRSTLDTAKWQKNGFVLVFRDSRKAVFTKMIWGGRDHPFLLDETG